MLKKISLRMRLTLLSAAVMASAAVILTCVFMFSANHIFVRELPQKIEFIPNEDIEIPYYGTDMGEEVGTLTFTIKEAGNQFNLWAMAGLLLVLFAGTGAAWLMAGRALKPLGDLSAAIEEIEGNDLTRRVDVQGRQDEIGRLAQAFNAMMDKVSASFERQRRFSASAAHELKTPLSTILVNLEVLELDGKTPLERMEKVLSIVKTNTERMISLVNDLFRLTSGTDGELCQQVRLEEVFAELSADLSGMVREKQLELAVGDMPDVNLRGSYAMICRAMGNLLENAVKYNRQGGTIEVQAEKQGETVAVQIADTGIGIPAEDLPHIFEPFYRVDRSRSRAVGGAGLGLPLVKDIVEKHGGSIEVKSAPGEGTVFVVRLPCGG